MLNWMVTDGRIYYIHKLMVERGRVLYLGSSHIKGKQWGPAVILDPVDCYLFMSYGDALFYKENNA